MNKAVIINEFGEVGLDHDLVETTDENIVELQNGCICCTIQDDLKSTLLDLIDKMQRKKISQFNKVVIETTGLADPVPIIHTLMTSLDLHRAYSIDGVITLVDAVNGEGTYDIHEEAIKQTALADRIILSKCDIADTLVIKSIINRIRIINPKAMIIEKLTNPQTESDRLIAAGELAKYWTQHAEAEFNYSRKPADEVVNKSKTKGIDFYEKKLQKKTNKENAETTPINTDGFAEGSDLA